MASLTFAEAKVVAPPILPRKHPANTAQTRETQETQELEHPNLKRPPLREGPNDLSLDLMYILSEP